MNDMTVGMENLPNVFIHKILINPTLIGYKIKVVLKMFDHENRSWYNRIPNLKVKLAMIENSDIIENLNSGLASLHDFPDLVNLFTVNASNFQKRKEIEDYSLYTHSITTNLNYKPQNLNAYAVCFMEDFGFGIKIFDKFYGPMVGERVLVNSELNPESSYFYYPDSNEEYAGPVHLHPNKGFMEGSKHSENPHKPLVEVKEENFKIIYGAFETESIEEPSIETAATTSVVNTAGPSVDAVANTVTDNTTGAY